MKSSGDNFDVIKDAKQYQLFFTFNKLISYILVY